MRFRTLTRRALLVACQPARIDGMASASPNPETPNPATPGPERVAEATRCLEAVTAGDGAAAAQLFELVYDELRRLAGRYLQAERPDHTLQPTALAHEAWMRLTDQSRVEWEGRSHFLAIAAQAMRRILVDHARSKKREKRGGGWQRVALDPDVSPGRKESLDLVELDSALEKLRGLHERPSQVVELRFFAGLPEREVAQVLGVSVGTVERDWRFASAWLSEALRSAT